MVTQTAYGAISVVNSLPSLLGSSAAINLKVNVVVSKSKNISLNGKPINDAFISTIVKHALEKCNGIGVSIDLKSEIPIASGLKSSSAVANALYKAICDEYNYKLELIEVAKITSKIAKKEGFSVTGAFDDSTSSLLGGITFTDNENFELIRRDVIDNDKYDVIICIPPYEKKIPFNI
jgi:Archaeal shikimate kinase